MKRNKLLVLALLVAVTSFSACTNDTEGVLAQESEIKLKSEITPSRVINQELQSTQIVPGQKVGVTITGAKSEHKNVAWTAGENGSLTNTGNAIYYGSGDATITAYHPFNDDWDENTSYAFSVSTNQSVDANYLNSDLLWATETSSKTESAIPLVFKHKLAKINVTLTSEDIADLSNATISICGTNITTNFNPADGTLSATTANVVEIKAGVTTTSAYTSSAIVVPQELASGTKFIKVIHNNKNFYYTLSADKEFKSGYSYSYTLNVKESKVEIDVESDNITDWTDEEATGDAEEDVFKMTAVDLGLSVKWAFCNLGAKADKEMGDVYAWGEISTKSIRTKENYAFYNVENDTYENLGDDISGTEYDAATAILGEGWRMPTKAEWEELKSNCTATSFEISGGYYYVFRSNINNNRIIIPHDYGPYYYWTSTDFTYSNASITGSDEFIAPYYFYVNYDYTEIYDRSIPYQGHYIRAVYDGE